MNLFNWKTAIGRFARGPRPSQEPPKQSPIAACDMRLFRIRSRDEYLDHVARSGEYLAMIQRVESSLVPPQGRDPFHVRGYSYTAGCEVDFRVGYEHTRANGSVNWRENLCCPWTGFNNRMRAAIHLFDIEAAALPSDRIYLSERITPMYRYFAAKYPNVVGSEYLGTRCPPGACDERGVRNESLSRLTFLDGSLDRIISLDCLEHFPDYERAFQECARVLAPRGTMLWSVPFLPARAENLIRARINAQGEVEHLLEPEYHSDPLTTDGCLCFTHFGWQMLDQARAGGFSDAYAVLVWSVAFGYLGAGQTVFFARK